MSRKDFTNGVSSAVRKSRTSLAAMLRDRIHEEIIADYWLMILSGKAPAIVSDKRETLRGCLKVIEDPNDKVAPSPERRDAAMKALLERRDGMPAQRVHLEAELRASITTTTVDATALAGLPPERLGAVVSALRAALGRPANVGKWAALPEVSSTSDDAEVEDAEVVTGEVVVETTGSEV